MLSLGLGLGLRRWCSLPLYPTYPTPTLTLQPFEGQLLQRNPLLECVGSSVLVGWRSGGRVSWCGWME